MERIIKKTMLVVFVVLICLISYSQTNVTPLKVLRIANSTTAFGQNISKGTLVYNLADKKVYVATSAIGSANTLSANIADFIEITLPLKAGNSGKVLAVNSIADGLEWVEQSDDQNASEVNLVTGLDIDGDGTNETTLEQAIGKLNDRESVAKGTQTGAMLYFDGTEWVELPPGNHNQVLRICNGVLTWGECPNNSPTGNAVIIGTAQEDAILTTDVSSIADIDGLGSFSYQWRADGSNISGAIANTYTLTQADVGKLITVNVTYTDLLGHNESLTSAATSAVANVNDAPTGTVTIDNTSPKFGEVLTASNNLDDEDGMGPITYQWKADDVAIGGATAATYTLTLAENNKLITVSANYTDLQGTAESVTSAATNAVVPNSLPTGSLTINGTAQEDATLTADASAVNDVDGLGVFSYQWKADGVAISGATATTYTLTQVEVGKKITVSISYTDGIGVNESVTSTETVAVANVNDNPEGNPVITGTAEEDQTLTADASAVNDADGLGTFSYQWKADNVAIGGATSTTYTLTQAEVGKAVTVTVSYTDLQGTAESVTSAATGNVANVNDLPAGTLAIDGTIQEDATLTANTSGITDEDGLTGAVYAYQWKADGTDISGATANTYTLTQAEVGKAITVTVAYTDDFTTNETYTSGATIAVVNVNDLPVGTPVITGSAIQYKTLEASVSGISDEDGLGTFSYQWKADDVAISGATSTTYTLTLAEVGKAITATVSYTDLQGTAESVTSAATSVVQPNNAPTGSVTISGTAQEDETLTADASSVADADGPPSLTLSYQWKANGVAISGATAATYTLTQAEVDNTITVTVSYTDNNGVNESVTSAATVAVVNVNDNPTGTVSVAGLLFDGQLLTASNDLDDEDGMGPITYQWKADDIAINGATDATYTLTSAELGKVMSVSANYTDLQGTAESVTFTAGVVVQPNNEPTGSITISGTAQEDETLTADASSVADADGPPSLTLSYQWKASGWDISGATATTYTLTQAEVDSTITVMVSYTDNNGINESLTSAATVAVVNVNDAPAGTLVIDGTAQEDETLTANTSGITDEDGLGTFSYQWKADAVAISGATSTSYTLTQAEIGKAITVTVSYTDLQGTAESVTSAATGSVANVNNLPDAVTLLPQGGGTIFPDSVLRVPTIVDLDGTTTTADWNYQWYESASSDFTSPALIASGADLDSLILIMPLVNKYVRAQVSYTDDYSTAESISSDTLMVQIVNYLPEQPVLTYSPAGVLTVSAVVDANGTTGSTFNYTWKLGGANIAGAPNADTYTPVSSGEYTVEISYQDDHLYNETIISNAYTLEPLSLDAVSGNLIFNKNMDVSLSGADYLVYDWQLSTNGGTTFESMAVINSPVKVSSDISGTTIKNYSNRGGNGTIHSNVSFESTGRLRFSPAETIYGTGYVTYDNVMWNNQLNDIDYTIILRAEHEAVTYHNGLILFGTLSKGIIANQGALGNIRIYNPLGNDETINISSSFNIEDDNLYCFRGSKTNLKINVNNFSAIDAITGTITYDAYPVTFGRVNDGQDWRGWQSDYLVFDRKISDEQYALLKDGVYNVIPVQETNIGEQWKVVVTPITGGVAGTPVISNSVTIP